MALGLGRPDTNALVFGRIDGNPPAPELSRDWAWFEKAKKTAASTFHGLRHSHVSALIARKVEVLTSYCAGVA